MDKDHADKPRSKFPAYTWKTTITVQSPYLYTTSNQFVAFGNFIFGKEVYVDGPNGKIVVGIITRVCQERIA